MDGDNNRIRFFLAPQKLRLVCDKVRGLDALQAKTVLTFMPQKGAEMVIKTYTYRADLVIDPFNGSGTTCAVGPWSSTSGRRVCGSSRGR